MFLLSGIHLVRMTCILPPLYFQHYIFSAANIGSLLSMGSLTMSMYGDFHVVGAAATTGGVLALEFLYRLDLMDPSNVTMLSFFFHTPSIVLSIFEKGRGKLTI